MLQHRAGHQRAMVPMPVLSMSGPPVRKSSFWSSPDTAPDGIKARSRDKLVPLLHAGPSRNAPSLFEIPDASRLLEPGQLWPRPFDVPDPRGSEATAGPGQTAIPQPASRQLGSIQTPEVVSIQTAIIT